MGDDFGDMPMGIYNRIHIRDCMCNVIIFVIKMLEQIISGPVEFNTDDGWVSISHLEYTESYRIEVDCYDRNSEYTNTIAYISPFNMDCKYQQIIDEYKIMEEMNK